MAWYDKNFLGRNGFLWFNGVVEDRNDPQKAGRLRVRCLGYHTDNKELLPTADLPWAQCVLPTTSPGISGLGGHSFVVEGSWVFGYFRDAEECQEPVILGTLPGKPSEYGKPSSGFFDPNAREDDENKSVYPREINEPDVNRLAVNNTDLRHPSLLDRGMWRTEYGFNIPQASFDGGTAAGGDTISSSVPFSSSWEMPSEADTYKAVYPYNHAWESERGHVFEIDDTLNEERIHVRHRTGTSTEMVQSGDRIETTSRNKYNVVQSSDYSVIHGFKYETINGGYRLYINADTEGTGNFDIVIGDGGSVNIQVNTGDANIITQTGNINLNAANNFNVKVGGDFNMQVKGNRDIIVNGTTNDVTEKEVQFRGKRIDLN